MNKYLAFFNTDKSQVFTTFVVPLFFKGTKFEK